MDFSEGEGGGVVLNGFFFQKGYFCTDLFPNTLYRPNIAPTELGGGRGGGGGSSGPPTPPPF